VDMVLMVAVALLAAENDLESRRWELCGEEVIACVRSEVVHWKVIQWKSADETTSPPAS
jgi:hypothetical protein